MAIKKRKKRRKRRSPQPVEVDSIENPEEKKKVQYKDDFQKTVGERVEDIGDKLEGKGKPILIGLAGLVLVGAIAGFFYYSSLSTAKAGQTALGKAIETSSARITDVPLPAGSTETVFKTKEERAKAAIAEFDAIIAKYGGDVGAKASYFRAMSQVDIDREAGAKELAEVAAKGGEAGSLAKFALAGIRGDDGKHDEAIKLYQELLAVENPVVAKITINSELAKMYEKSGKKKEAANVYYEIAKGAKVETPESDSATPALPPQKAPSVIEAETKLKELDPELAKKLEEPADSEDSEDKGEEKAEDEQKESGDGEKKDEE